MREDLGARHHGEGLLEHAVVARVAVVHGTGDQRAIAADQPEVHAPGVHADSVEAQLALASGDGEPAPDFVEQPERVPLQARGRADGIVGEAMQLLKLEPAVFESAENGAPALGAQIEGEVLSHVTKLRLTPCTARRPARSPRRSQPN